MSSFEDKPGMTPERYEKVMALFHAASGRAAGERAAFLAEACAGDDALRREVEELLTAGEKQQGLLDEGWAELESTVTAAQFGPYRMEEKIGEGGMGMVFRAHDTKLNRPVAIKFLAGDVASAEARRRFQREAQMASSLNHPHILTVYDAGEWEGRQYLVTEYLSGGTLKEWVRAEKRPWRQVVELLVGVADGLATAHAAGILHRDIKPGNILMHASGYAKLADFGLAKLAQAAAPAGKRKLAEGPTRPGAVIGTIPYMSPEQASGKELDARSDVFSFGTVLYEAVAGRRPFTGPSDLEVLQAILHATLAPLGEQAPPGLRVVVEKALEKDPADRYQSMREMVVDLRRLARQSVETPAAVIAQPARRFKWIAAAAALIASGTAAAIIWLWPRQPARLEYTQLTNFSDSATSPALSPDGKMLTFIRGLSSFTGRGQIYVKILPDGEPKLLTQDDHQIMSPLFSPDGSRIAYTTVDERNEWDTWEVPVLGGHPRRLLPNASGLIWVSRQKLLFSEKIRNSKGNHMKIVAAAESRAEARDVYVPMPRGAMAHRSYASPDGKWVLVAEMNDRGFWLPCRLVPMDGSSTGQPVGPRDAACWFAAWSPDGKWMYLNANANGGFHIWRQRFAADRPDSEPEQITSGPMEEEGLAMAPDGRSLITSVGLRHSAVWLRDSNGERQISLEGFARQVQLTPDGKRLLYVVGASALPERTELWMADLDSGRNEPLLPGFPLSRGGGRHVFDISPDGRQVVVESLDNEGKSRLWLAYLDRRAPPQQIPNVEGDGPLFLPDGEIIFRGREGDYGAAYRVRADGSGLRKAYEYPITGITGLSPDGQWLVVYARPSEHEAGATLALPVAGGSPVRLLGNSTSARWSRNGELFFLSIGTSYYSGYTGYTYVVPLARGRMLPEIPGGGFPSAQALAKLPGVRIIDTPDVAPGPTPDVYAFSRGKVQRNLYRVPVP